MVHLGTVIEEDDLVHEVWLRVLPNLPSLRDRDGKWTPVLLRYLGTTLLHYANDVYRRELRRRLQREQPTTPAISVSALPADVTNALSRALRNEVSEQIMESLGRLSTLERSVFLQRAMEGLRNDDIAAQTGETKQTISMRYARALAKLRAVMPDGLLDDLDDTDAP